MRNSSKKNIDYTQCYGGQRTWTDDCVDKTVSFHSNDRENKTRGRINHHRAIDQPDSLKAESQQSLNFRRSQSERSNRNDDKMRIPANIQNPDNVQKERISSNDREGKKSHRKRSVSECSHYSCRSQSLTKPLEKYLNSKTLCYEVNSTFVCEDWKNGNCAKGYDCEKQHFYFLKMGQWNTDLSKNPPNPPKIKPCLNKGIQIQQENPAHYVLVRTVETKLVSVKEARALFEGSERESGFRYEISVAVTNEKAMEEFQKEVVGVSQNNGKSKITNDEMDIERTDLWRCFRRKLAKKNNEHQDDGYPNSGSGIYSSQEQNSAGKSSQNELIQLIEQKQELEEKIAELTNASTIESKNTRNQQRKLPHQPQQQQYQQFQKVINKQSTQIISKPSHRNHGQVGYLPTPKNSNGKQYQKQQQQQSQKFIPNANSKASSKPKVEYIRKPMESSDNVSLEFSLTDQEVNEKLNKQNGDTKMLFEENKQEFSPIMCKPNDIEQSIFDEDQQTEVNEQQLTL